MKIFREPFPKLNTPVASVALGTFDGLHEGHRTVIFSAMDEAKRLGGLSAVWCFASPPKNIFVPGSAKPLMTSEEKALAISSLGVDIVISAEPTHELLSMEAPDFVRRLTDALSPSSVFCGFNFTFGARALGTTYTLASELSKKNIALTVIPPVTDAAGIPVSSTLMRRRLHEKD